MEPLSDLLSLFTSPVGTAEVKCIDYGSDKYCLTLENYVIFPKEVMDSTGNSVTRFLKCLHIIINTKDKDTYLKYEDTIKAYLKTTTDPIKVNYFGSKPVTVSTPKPEYAEDIKRVEFNRQQHRDRVNKLEKKFDKEMKDLGADAWVYSVKMINWPEKCQFKDEWYQICKDQNYSECQIGITCHCETGLYQNLKKNNLLN